VACLTDALGPILLHSLNPESRGKLTCTHGETLMYIDPTTGSLVLQFLAAGVLSVLAMVSRVREAIKAFFRMLVPRRRR
jgi:hypothetical protein